MSDKAKRPRPVAEIEADMARAARRGDNVLILLAVIAAAVAAWMTTPYRRMVLVESLGRDAINGQLCQAYLTLAPGKTYTDFPVCLPPTRWKSVDGH